jgi:hypothetical protein
MLFLGTIFMPTTLSNTFFLVNKTMQWRNLSIVAYAPSTATAIELTSGSFTSFIDIRIVGFLLGLDCQGVGSTYTMYMSLFFGNTLAVNVDNCNFSVTTTSVVGAADISSGPANMGINTMGAGAVLTLTGCAIVLCEDGIIALNGCRVITAGTLYQANQNDIAVSASAQISVNSCVFQFTIDNADVKIRATDTGTTANVNGSEFDGLSVLGVVQGTGVLSTNGAVVNVSGGSFKNFTTGTTSGVSGDTSSTTLKVNSTTFLNNKTDIRQEGTSTLSLIAANAHESKVVINDNTNVTLAYFDEDNNDALNIGKNADVDFSLLHAAIGLGDDPRLVYKSSLYGEQAIGYENPSFNSCLFSLSPDESHICAITTDRTKTAHIRLVSDTGGTVGTTTALRGWDIMKEASSSELSFQYQNSDTVGQSTIPIYTVAKLDGVNNQFQLPTAGAKIVFSGDTNLYRSSANVLKTDGNLVVGGLTANRALIANGSQQLASSATTDTELSYVAGVTSSIQPQINSKAGLAGATFTGTVTLPAGSTAAPSLNFTGT